MSTSTDLQVQHFNQANDQAGDMPRLLLRPREAAQSLGISERTLWNLTQAGTIPPIRLGRSVRYDPEVLRQWIADQRPSLRGDVTP